MFSKIGEWIIGTIIAMIAIITVTTVTADAHTQKDQGAAAVVWQ